AFPEGRCDASVQTSSSSFPSVGARPFDVEEELAGGHFYEQILELVATLGEGGRELDDGGFLPLGLDVAEGAAHEVDDHASTRAAELVVDDALAELGRPVPLAERRQRAGGVDGEAVVVVAVVAD